MAIYLDETQDEHSQLIKAVEESFMAPWLKNSFVYRIQSDIDRRRENALCEHSEGDYVGQRTCCVKCGSYFKPGMGESWRLTNDK